MSFGGCPNRKSEHLSLNKKADTRDEVFWHHFYHKVWISDATTMPSLRLIENGWRSTHAHKECQSHTREDDRLAQDFGYNCTSCVLAVLLWLRSTTFVIHHSSWVYTRNEGAWLSAMVCRWATSSCQPEQTGAASRASTAALATPSTWRKG